MASSVKITNTTEVPLSITVFSKYKYLEVPANDSITVKTDPLVVATTEEQVQYYMDAYNGKDGLTVEEVSGSDKYAVAFKVVDDTGTGIAGATISATGLTQQTTASGGTATFSDVEPKSYEFTIAADGKTSVQATLNVNANAYAYITMKTA